MARPEFTCEVRCAAPARAVRSATKGQYRLRLHGDDHQHRRRRRRSWSRATGSISDASGHVEEVRGLARGRPSAAAEARAKPSNTRAGRASPRRTGTMRGHLPLHDRRRAPVRSRPIPDVRAGADRGRPALDPRQRLRRAPEPLPSSLRRSPRRRPENMVHHTMNRQQRERGEHLQNDDPHGGVRCVSGWIARSRHLLAGDSRHRCGMRPARATRGCSARHAGRDHAGGAATTRAPTTLTRARSRWVPAGLERVARLERRPHPRAVARVARRLRQAGRVAGPAVCKLAGAHCSQPTTRRRATSCSARCNRTASKRWTATAHRLGHRLLRALPQREPHAAQHEWQVSTGGRPPADLATRRPWWTRQQLDTLPAARASVRGHEIAYVCRSARCTAGAGAGLRARAHHRARRPRTAACAWLTPATTTTPTSRSAAGWSNKASCASSEASWQAIRDWARRYPGAGSTRCCGATRAWCFSVKSRCPR